ncbi:MAG: pseudouridine synthase [Patescibacteria group bacterium]
MEKENLTKVIATHTQFSRRKAEELIRLGRVKIDNRPATLGEKIGEEEKIEIDNVEIKRNNKKLYIKMNKPVGYTCTNKDFLGEKNIFSLIKLDQKLSSIGRLDKNSSGLILLTNDGDLNFKLSHPKFEHQKIYLVEIKEKHMMKSGGFVNKIKESFLRGLDIGEKTLAKAKKVETINNTTIFKITLSEGKKRQIREMFRYFDLQVESLQRIEFAGIRLGDLKEGEWKHLEDAEIKTILK